MQNACQVLWLLIPILGGALNKGLWIERYFASESEKEESASRIPETLIPTDFQLLLS
jgi:hypothetical protein